MLCGCRGGGGQTTPTSPDISSTNLNLAGGSSTISTSTLFDKIRDGDMRWISLIDNDNGYIRLRGVSELSEETAGKLPDPQPLSGLTTQYSMISHVQTRLNAQSDPGRYILWGTRTRQPVLDIPLSYNLNGQWTCVQCTDDGTLRDGRIHGLLMLNALNDNADLRLDGDGLDQQKTLSSRLLPTGLYLDGTRLTPIRSDILGSLFGDENQEAGIIFGIADDQGRVISGGALGQVNKEVKP